MIMKPIYHLDSIRLVTCNCNAQSASSSIYNITITLEVFVRNRVKLAVNKKGCPFLDYDFQKTYFLNNNDWKHNFGGFFGD